MDITVVLIDDDPCFQQKLKHQLRLLFAGIATHDFSNFKEAIMGVPSMGGHDINTTPPYLLFVSESCIDGDMPDFLKRHGRRAVPIVVTKTVHAEAAQLHNHLPLPNSCGERIYRMHREHIRSPLFKRFVQHLIEENMLLQHRRKEAALQCIEEHLGTLQHEINNPLEVLFGTAYLLQHSEVIHDEQKRAAQRIEESGRRIKLILDSICAALETRTQPLPTFSPEDLFHQKTMSPRGNVSTGQ